MEKKITRKVVENFLAKNRPNLAAYENKRNKVKGVYVKSLGPAASFTTRGKTWREVLESFSE